MTLLNIIVFPHKLSLELLELGTVNLLEPAALYTNEMVMVFVIVLVLVAQGAVSEIDWPAQTRFADKLYRPGHRRVSYPFVLSPDQIIQLLDGHMLFDGKEHIQNIVSLAGASKALVSYKLCELLFGVHYFYPIVTTA